MHPFSSQEKIIEGGGIFFSQTYSPFAFPLQLLLKWGVIAINSDSTVRIA